MPVVLSPNQKQIQQVLRSSLLAFLPPGVDVIEGQDNRVAEPSEPDFVVMTAFQRVRLMTNVDARADAAYAGSLNDAVLIVSHVLIGTVEPGATLFGTSVAPGTVIGAQLSGSPGGVGTYAITPSQTVPSEVMASGTASAMQETEITFQLDVHGPGSADNAQTLSTVLRDPYGVRQFAEASVAAGIEPGLVTPLYADDPRQAPFTNDQDQVETRWVVSARIQANQTVLNIPQQFADVLGVTPVSVDVTYPPS